MEKIWDQVLEEVSKKVPQMYFEPFISPLSLDCVQENKIIIKAPSVAIQKHVEKKYQGYIQEAIEKIKGKKIQVEINTNSIDKPVESPISLYKDDYNLNPDYDFSTFIVGNSNRLAFFAAKELIQQPGLINPLYVYGKVGVGKTHLIQSIGAGQREKYPGRMVKYISIANFLSEFVANVQNRQAMELFKQKYQSYDTLIIDDIQALNSGAEKTQEEFFNIFNYLFERKKQIVIASDRATRELPLQERLRSRFETGVQVDIQPPDSDVRTRILQNRSSILDLNLCDKSIEYISDSFPSDTRGLIGSLNDISIYKRSYGLLLVTIEQVKEVIEKRLQNFNYNSNPEDKIIDFVSTHFSLQRKDVVGKSRKAEFIIPRHLCMYLLHTYCKLNKTVVGRIFSTKHTTVINAISKIQKLMSSNDDFKIKIRSIISRLDL